MRIQSESAPTISIRPSSAWTSPSPPPSNRTTAPPRGTSKRADPHGRSGRERFSAVSRKISTADSGPAAGPGRRTFGRATSGMYACADARMPLPLPLPPRGRHTPPAGTTRASASSQSSLGHGPEFVSPATNTYHPAGIACASLPPRAGSPSSSGASRGSSSSPRASRARHASQPSCHISSSTGYWPRAHSSAGPIFIVVACSGSPRPILGTNYFGTPHVDPSAIVPIVHPCQKKSVVMLLRRGSSTGRWMTRGTSGRPP